MGAPASLTRILAPLLIDGRGGPPLQRAALLLEGSTIRAVGTAEEVRAPDGAAVETLEYPNATVLPGLIDTHTHLNGFGDGRLGDELAESPDELLLLQAARNARVHLETGVTTLRDCGSKHGTAFQLRRAIAMGIAPGPRLYLCGRPVTITGGHMWYFGQEADGPDGVRRAVRQLLKEGADFIKIVATGGSTRTSYPARPAYNPGRAARHRRRGAQVRQADSRALRLHPGSDRRRGGGRGHDHPLRVPGTGRDDPLPARGRRADRRQQRLGRLHHRPELGAHPEPRRQGAARRGLDRGGGGGARAAGPGAGGPGRPLPAPAGDGRADGLRLRLLLGPLPHRAASSTR